MPKIEVPKIPDVGGMISGQVENVEELGKEKLNMVKSAGKDIIPDSSMVQAY